MSEEKELESLIGIGQALEINGQTLEIKPLKIKDLPKASELSKALFDGNVDFTQQHFSLDLNDKQIESIADLIALTSDIKVSELLEVSSRDFMQAFNLFVQVNGDFFFLSLIRMTQGKQAGQVCLQDSSDTDIATQSSTP
jgi:hypothetical protein